MSYNGYASQDEFHQALQRMAEKYAAERAEGMRDNPDGWRHADCDHAYGICSEGGWK